MRPILPNWTIHLVKVALDHIIGLNILRKKDLASSIEDELIRLIIVNQKLLKRLQGHVALEQEAVRLKCMLVDIRGRIKEELGSFPYQKPINISGGNPRNMPDALSTLVIDYNMNWCDLQYP
ncbi:hypothetical protein MKX03_021229 [Papaver bracteatum]|nr:hypothetical protein MKX03_021229 [Papaver bracteatum]